MNAGRPRSPKPAAGIGLIGRAPIRAESLRDYGIVAAIVGLTSVLAHVILDGQERLALVLLGSASLSALYLAAKHSRVWEDGRRAAARAQTMTVLFDASRQLTATDREDALRRRLAEHMAAACGGEAVVYDEQGGWRASGGAAGGAGARAFEDARGWSRRPLSVGEQAAGLIMWRPTRPSPLDPREQEAMMQLLIDLGAAAVARLRLADETARGEAMAQTERLRTALLASISHDLRTPLATVLASVTSLIDFEDRFAPEVRRRMLEDIRTEAERLNRFLCNLMEMTRLESGALVVRAHPVSLCEALDRVVRSLAPGADGGRFRISLAEAAVALRCDPILLEHVLFNVIENALAYSPPDAGVELEAAAEGNFAVLEISDLGPGVPEADRPRVFDKFYRIRETAGARPGAGLGLSIARGLIEAMGGSIAAEARRDGRPGLRVRITIPRERSDA